MAKDLYLYDVFDVLRKVYVLQQVPLSEVMAKLNMSKARIINATL